MLMKKFIIIIIALLFSFVGADMPSAYAETWTQMADYGGKASAAQVGFSIGVKGYVWELGTKTFWEYDPSTNVWTQLLTFPGTIKSDAVGFSIGTKGYLGIGKGVSGYLKEFWEYDPGTNKWTQKTDFGGDARYAAVGFSIGSKGYIGTGYGYTDALTYVYEKDFWEYDPATGVGGTWTKKADFGGIARGLAVGFSIGSKGYIGTGSDGLSYYKDFWEYDPDADTWTQMSDFGGIEREWAVGFSIASKGYIGTGHATSGSKKDFWEYAPSTGEGDLGTWTQKTDLGGAARYAATGFSIGSKGYIGTGYTGAYSQDYWEYNPAGSITPDSFTFTTQTGVALSTPITSNAITVSGITSATAISITGGYYAISTDSGGTWGDWTNTAGTVQLDNKVKVRQTSSASYSTTTTATLTIGGVSGTFSVITLGGDTTPNPFTFEDKSGVGVNKLMTSNTITVSGIAVASPISITGGTYSINGGTYTSAAGTVNNNDTVTVQQTSSNSYSTATAATLTIGGVSDTFTVTTQDKPTGDGGGGGGCFIATAAFGSPLAGQVEILRQFRDRYLLTNAWGKKFVSWYYRNGPVAAGWIKDKPLAKAAVQAALYPLIVFSFLLISGYLPLAVVGVLLSMLLFLRFKPKRLSVR
jgi:hypothetical protein